MSEVLPLLADSGCPAARRLSKLPFPLPSQRWMVADNQYESSVTGTLLNGDAISQKIICRKNHDVPDEEPCAGVEIIAN